jgi:hypothetical protein
MAYQSVLANDFILQAQFHILRRSLKAEEQPTVLWIHFQFTLFPVFCSTPNKQASEQIAAMKATNIQGQQCSN